MRITDQDIQKAKEYSLEKLLPSNRMNGNLIKYKCPFDDHDDSTASFTIYRISNSYYCFGCNRGGSTIDFIKQIASVGFIEAVEYLSNK